MKKFLASLLEAVAPVLAEALIKKLRGSDKK